MTNKDNKKSYFKIAFLLYLFNYLLILKASIPGKIAVSPRASSILKSWLYFAILSEREAEPVLICPQFIATARSAMVESSVSPER